MPQAPTAKKPSRKLVLSAESVRVLAFNDQWSANAVPTATCYACASRPCRPSTFVCTSV